MTLKSIYATLIYKVFELKFINGDTEHIIGKSKEEIVTWYNEYLSCSDEGGIWRELTDYEIDEKLVGLKSWQDEFPEDGWPSEIKMRDYIKDCMLYDGKEPEIICSTDF